MKMITNSLNIQPRQTYIALHKHRCLPILLKRQTLIVLIQLLFSINESYENVNNLNPFHCNHIYMNEIMFFLNCYQDQLNLENI